MQHTDHVIRSAKLGKDVDVRVYGTKGYPIVAFPTQDQMADEWEANGMTEVFAPYVGEGRVQLFTVDSNDLESWSSESDDFAARIARQEDYYDFVCEELLPYVHQANHSMLRPELVGCSLGATQATIVALRRPDLFQGAIALSGMYHTSYFFGDWGNDVSYANDVNAFLPNTPADHPYLELYRHRTFAFSIGQAADEQFGVGDLRFLQETFGNLGIEGWFDFWGPECTHDWYWWKQQMAKFLPEAVSELEGVAAVEPELAKLPAQPKVDEAPEPAAKDATEAKREEASSKPAKHAASKASARKVVAKRPAAAAETQPAPSEPTAKPKAVARKTGAASAARRPASKPAAAKGPEAKAATADGPSKATVAATKKAPTKTETTAAKEPATADGPSKATVTATKKAPAKAEATAAKEPATTKAGTKAKAGTGKSTTKAASAATGTGTRGGAKAARSTKATSRGTRRSSAKKSGK